MAVDQVTRMWSKRKADISTSDRKKYVAVQSDAYQVTVTDPTTTIATILQHADVPKAGDLLAPSSSLYCRKVSPQQVSPIMWVVNVTWQGDIGPDGLADSPLNQPPKLTWSDVETSEPANFDFNGNPIVTANGEPINGVSIPIVDQVLTVQRNFASINPFAIGPYRQSTNSDVFAGWPAGTVRLTRYNAVSKAGDGTTADEYWDVTASFQFRFPYVVNANNAWDARVLHQGYLVREFRGNDSQGPVFTLHRALDDDGAPTSQPVNLSLDGFRSEQPSFLIFKRFGSLPFASLGLLD